MGRPPLQGQPAFRFLPREIADMEKILEEHNGSNPQREVIYSLAEKFSTSPERAGKIVVQWKQIWNWFQNRRHAQRSKTAKVTSKPNSIPSSSDESTVKGTPSVTSVAISEKIDQDTEIMDFEARSARDQAWYDVAGFLTFRCLQPEDPEVLVRFAGFGPEEDEWVNVKRSVRRRSLPCEVTECVAVLPGDLILCFQEGKEQALYYDAHILDVQRNRHDIRGCRCRFLVRYDHDNSEEIVPLRKVCRRPETDMRLKKLQDPKISSPARCMTQDVKDATDPVGVSNTESGAGILLCTDSAIPSSTPKTSSVIAFPSSEKAYNSTKNPQSNPNTLVSSTEKDDSQPNKVPSQGDPTAAET